MNQQQNNFLNIITAYVLSTDDKSQDYIIESHQMNEGCETGKDDKSHDLILESPDWNEIYKLSHIHSLSGMLYKVVKNQNLCTDETLMSNMEKAYMLTVGNFMRQEFALSSLLNLLNSNNIRHIIFKGTVLREYYPDKELRTMGDIDIIIDAANKERTHKVLLEAGAFYDEVASHGDVSNYNLNGVLFEIHTKVIETNLFENVDYKGYFSDLFSHAELREAYTYEFTKEFHLIYLLVHMAKHFKFGGCGLRMYIDIVMFLRHFGYSAGNSFAGNPDGHHIEAEPNSFAGNPDGHHVEAEPGSLAGNPDGHHVEAEPESFAGDLDWGYIKTELEKLRLVDFADSVFQFCNRWFGTDIALFRNEAAICEDTAICEDAAICEDETLLKDERISTDIDMITEYVLAGGTFGHHDKNIDAIRAGNKGSGVISKVKTVVFFLFPSYENLKRRYEWMKNTPRWMLPIAWVRYWYYRIFVVKQNNLKRIKDAVGSGGDAGRHYQLLKKIGLE